jgi:hypothetical protein
MCISSQVFKVDVVQMIVVFWIFTPWRVGLFRIFRGACLIHREVESVWMQVEVRSFETSEQTNITRCRNLKGDQFSYGLDEYDASEGQHSC